MTVKVDVTVPLAAGVTEGGAKLQVTVAVTGAVEQVKLTAKLNPFEEVTLTVDVAEFPALTVAAAGAVDTLKSLTVNV